MKEKTAKAKSKVVKELFPSGKVSAEVSYVNGVPEGAGPVPVLCTGLPPSGTRCSL